jgi:hypothetical protein
MAILRITQFSLHFVIVANAGEITVPCGPPWALLLGLVVQYFPPQPTYYAIVHYHTFLSVLHKE